MNHHSPYANIIVARVCAERLYADVLAGKSYTILVFPRQRGRFWDIIVLQAAPVE